MCIDDGSECSSWSKSLSLKATPTSGNIAVKHDNMELKVTNTVFKFVKCGRTSLLPASELRKAL